MIRFDFLSLAIEGMASEYHPREPLFSFRVQHPVGVDAPVQLLDGTPLDFIARTRNRAQGRDVSVTSEYEVWAPGRLEVISHLTLGSVSTRLVFGVLDRQDAIEIEEAEPSGLPWFVNEEFVEINPEYGSRVVVIARRSERQGGPVDPEPSPRTVWDHFENDDDAIG